MTSLTLPIVAATLFGLWITTDAAYAISPQERWRRDEAFRQKVRDLEIDYKDRPQDLRMRTVLLAFLGYSVVFSSIGLLIAAGIWLGNKAVALTHLPWAMGVGLTPLGFAARLARPLFSPRGGDSGVQLSRREAPTLFALLDKIRKNAKGPPFERVFINMDMNASVSRHTGFGGFFGFGPVTLTLGLPLMQALTTSQTAGVVGHEYGHVAARDNALGQWVYRIRNSWLHLEDNLKTDHLWYAFRLNRFYQWFMSVFNAYSFTLSRQCEYEADAFAAKVVGAKHISGALVAMEVRNDLLQRKFWDGIWKKSEDMPDPSGNPYQNLGKFFKSPDDSQNQIKTLEKTVTGYDSTHPALPDRIKALRGMITAPEPLERSAATKLLGPALETQLASLFDRAWKELNRPAWKKRYREYQVAGSTLRTLSGKKIHMLTRDELAQMVDAANILHQDQKVIEACEELVKREPDNTNAKAYLLGFQLSGGDEAALHQLDDLVRLHPEHMPTACRFAIRHLEKQDRLEEAKVYRFRLDDWNYRHQAAEEERRTIFPTDLFAPHSLKPEYPTKIAAILKRHPAITMAWMVRKKIDYMKDDPLFVIGLKRGMGKSAQAADIIKDLERAVLQNKLPPYFRFFWVNDVPGLESRLRRIGGSRIH